MTAARRCRNPPPHRRNQPRAFRRTICAPPELLDGPSRSDGARSRFAAITFSVLTPRSASRIADKASRQQARRRQSGRSTSRSRRPPTTRATTAHALTDVPRLAAWRAAGRHPSGRDRRSRVAKKRCEDCRDRDAGSEDHHGKIDRRRRRGASAGPAACIATRERTRMRSRCQRGRRPTAMIPPSAMRYAIRRPRGAPSASRIEISFVRDDCLARIRFATFAHATSRTSSPTPSAARAMGPSPVMYARNIGSVLVAYMSMRLRCECGFRTRSAVAWHRRCASVER